MAAEHQEPMQVLKGASSEVVLYSDALVIRPVNPLIQFESEVLHTQRRIALTDIEDAAIFEPRFLTSTHEGDLRKLIIRTADETITVVYSQAHCPEARAIRDAVRALIGKGTAAQTL